MNRVIIHTQFIAACCVTICSNTYASDVVLQEILQRPFVKATFQKQRQLKILKRPFITDGIVLFLPDKGVVWYTQKPLENTLIIKTTGEMKTLNQDIGVQGGKHPMIDSAARVFLAILSLKLEKIQALFIIEKLPAQKDLHRYKLTPKEQQLNQVVEQIVLAGRNRLEEIQIAERSGDSTTIKFSNELFEINKLSSAEQQMLALLE